MATPLQWHDADDAVITCVLFIIIIIFLSQLRRVVASWSVTRQVGTAATKVHFFVGRIRISMCTSHSSSSSLVSPGDESGFFFIISDCGIVTSVKRADANKNAPPPPKKKKECASRTWQEGQSNYGPQKDTQWPRY